MIAALASAALAGPGDCGTLRMLPLAPPLRPIPVAAAAPPGELGLRDVYGVPNVETSAHFAVRWGNGAGVTDDQVGRLLDSLEEAWRVQVEAMAHPAPLGSDAFLFNVYVGDTGDGAPGSGGASGYYWVDAEGAPMIVVAAGILPFTDWADATAIHEFYHAIQGSLARFSYDGLGAWFWEATAEWAALQTHPWNPETGSLLFGYVLLPHLPVNAFTYPEEGALEEYHQYGAFLLPHYLTTEVVDFALVRDAWVVPDGSDDPLEVLRAGLAADGIDFDEAWLDHVAANAAWDYAEAVHWQPRVDAVAQYVPGARPIAFTVTGDGVHEPVRVEAEDGAPGRYGYNVLVLDNPLPGDLEVAIAGDARGDQGSPATFGAQVVRIDGGDVRYTRVPFDGTTGTATVPVDGADEIRVVVSAWTTGTARWETEVFPYDVTMAIGEPPTEEASGGVRIGNVQEVEEVPQACAAATPGATWLALPALLSIRLRGARTPGPRRAPRR